MSLHSLPARGREIGRLLRASGLRGLARRTARAAYQRTGAAALEGQLDFEEIADSRRLNLAVPARRPPRGTPLTIGWLCTPPAGGSGGHTTLFRMIEGVEAAGHTSVIYTHDVFAGELERHERRIRRHWPNLRAEIRSTASGLPALDAYVASGWETAHLLAARAEVPTRRLYFIQDFEPLFYPAGSHYVLAEDTYRFGFRAITVGPMLADLLLDRFGTEAQVAEFGCDTSVYRLTNTERRTGVVFYAKPTYARRGFLLGALALRELHRKHPHHEIDLFGDPGVKLPFPATNHGTLPPTRLSELYNDCAAGIAMSFTNLSLVPDEMLACGTVPVVGESSYAKASMDNPHVRWASPTPSAIADALGEAVGNTSPSPADIASSIRSTQWADAVQTVLHTIEEEVYGSG